VLQFTQILVYIDPESEKQPALRRAMRLAQNTGAAVHLLDVIEEPPSYAVVLTKQLQIDDRLGSLHKERVERLEAFAAPLRSAGHTVSIQATTGKPFLEIIRAVLRHNHDLVIKTIEAERGVKQVVFGSTDMHLLRKCPQALWLIKPTEPERYRRILVAVEPDVEEQDKFALSARLVRLGTAMAQAEGAKLFIVHAWTAFAERKFRTRLEPYQFGQYVRESKQQTQQKMRTFLSTVGGDISPANVHLVKGDASTVIPRFARKQAVDLVVMGTVGRSGVPGILIGNTAERMLNRLTCSILAIKPAGFVSPVSL
jgi:nucleotide-binding universal stress UspA family protein